MKGVVPVVKWWTESRDGRVEHSHGFGHAVAGGIGVEAAVEAVALREQRGEPGGVGSRSGSGDAEAVGMERDATDGVDGRLAEDRLLGKRSADGEVTEILA